MKTAMKWALRSGGVLFALLVALVLGLYYGQNSMIYHPAPFGSSQRAADNREGYRNPAERSLKYSEIRTNAEDGITLRGWFIPQPEAYAAATVIFYHENALNLGYRLDYFTRLYEKLKVNIIAFSYRGFGDSDGTPSEEGIQLDGKAILKYAFEKAPIDRDRVFVMGRSLGGAVAIYSLATMPEVQARGLILENTFTSIDDMVDVTMPLISFAKSLVLRNHWPSEELIAAIQKPILFISGLKDELVPPEQMKALHQAAKNAEFTVFFAVPNGSHNGTWLVAGAEYFLEISKFMEKASHEG